MFRRCILAGLLTLTLYRPASAQLVININPGPGLSANPAALAAFDRAAKAWENLFTDPITVNIDADLSNGFGDPNILGGTISTFVEGSYSFVRDALVADAADEPSNGIVAFLPTAAQFSAQLPPGWDLDGGIALTSANAKALGGNINVPSDATIIFNSDFAFDYDSANGVDPNEIDFQTVATHEIGHALGFDSAVDNVDFSLNPFPLALNPLDLFRFQAGSLPTTAAEFTTNPRDLTPGDDASFSDTMHSYRFSTGAFLGDGNQASHWKDDALTGNLIGIMDPTLDFGAALSISPADIRAFDLIGWDVRVPEPGSLALFASLGLTGVALRRRRRSSLR